MSHGDRRSETTLGLASLLIWLVVFGAVLAGLEQLAGWPGQPGLPDRLPTWNTVQVWLNSPFAAMGRLLPIALDIGWLVWALTAASIALQVVVDLLDAATRGAAWVTSVRQATDWLVLPPIRRAVDASLGGLLLARVLVQPVAAAEASALPAGAVVSFHTPDGSGGSARRPVLSVAQDRAGSRAPTWWLGDAAPAADEATSDPEVIYTVQPGDTLWALGTQFYGDAPGGAERIFEANQGRQQPAGRVFDRRGLIYPGWTLRIPDPTRGLERSEDGTWWYAVQPGDTLDGISARLLGDPNRGLEIFQLNRGARAAGGQVLVDPNLIWPGLRLQIPLDNSTAPPTEPQAPADSATTPTAPPSVGPFVGVEPDHREQPPTTPAPAASVTSQPSPTVAPTPAPTEAEAPVEVPPTVQATSAIQPVEQGRTESGHSVPQAVAALGAAAAAAAALAASQLVVHKRKPGRDPDGPESDVTIRDGFAEVDPLEHLARRVAHTSDPAAAIASLLAQAYAAIFDEVLQPDECRALDEVTLAATHHGRSSTTLILAAPVAARPYFIHHMRAAAERAFGSQVDVDGLVGQDGDVFVRVTWDSRRPIDGRLLELVGTSAAACAWPTPCLVPAFVPYDRQHLAINWHTIRNVLIAASTGQGADAPLTALVAALASVCAPEDLGLVVIARPHTLSDEIGRLPHNVLDVIDPADPEVVRHALEDVKLEIDRRRQARLTDEPELVVAVRELGDLDAEAMAIAAVIATTGPEQRVRLVAASERPASELLRLCPFMDRLGTRLVLQTASEEDSVALLGMPGAEYIGAGGHARLRVEGRRPEHGWAHRVSPDNLARLVHLMGTRTPAASPAAPAPRGESSPKQSAAPEVLEPSDVPAAGDNEPRAEVSPARAIVATAANEPTLLEKLRSAPIRVRCFGAREVRCGDRLLELADSRRLELLLLLAVHPVTGIRAELLVEMLWPRPPADSAAALRGDRFDLRTELQRLAPEIGSADPVPAKQFHGEKVVTLDPKIVASDVHEFTELLSVARRLEPAAAIQAYEAALALYQGDLLDSATVPNYRWMYDEDPEVAVGLCSELRADHKEARLHLAELLAAGGEDGLQRAEDLYSGLCAEDLGDEHLWIALFRIYERTGSPAGLEGAVRWYRNAQIELGTTDVTDIDKVPLPPNLKKIVSDIRSRIGSTTPTT